jgi:hypothetical protein
VLNAQLSTRPSSCVSMQCHHNVSHARQPVTAPCSCLCDSALLKLLCECDSFPSELCPSSRMSGTIHHGHMAYQRMLPAHLLSLRFNEQSPEGPADAQAAASGPFPFTYFLAACMHCLTQYTTRVVVILLRPVFQKHDASWGLCGVLCVVHRRAAPNTTPRLRQLAVSSPSKPCKPAHRSWNQSAISQAHPGLIDVQCHRQACYTRQCSSP